MRIFALWFLCFFTTMSNCQKVNFAFDYPMVAVEGDCFMMGCVEGRDGECNENEQAHRVCVSDFIIGKYEVTQAQWEAVMGENPSYFSNCENCPVETVSWDMAQEFIKKLNTKTGLNYGLPTESQWEYAARGGKLSKDFQYAGSDDLDDIAWSNHRKTREVGQKGANELGLYDMAGNVWEWCSDEYLEYPYAPDRNPVEPGNSGSFRVLRGGAWDFKAPYCRSAYRRYSYPVNAYLSYGIRLVLKP